MILTCLTVLGCNPPGQKNTPAAPTYGHVEGFIQAPQNTAAPKIINQDSDPFCSANERLDESLLVGAEGGLQNVVIRILGLPNSAAPGEPVKMAQEGCSFSPRVVSIVAGQTLSISNDDDTFHNVHTYRGKKALFSIAHPPGAPPIDRNIHGSQESILNIKCDIHPWMRGYAVVHNNQWVAISDHAGKFSFRNVPAGKWPLELWHETLGKLAGEITVSPKQVTTLQLSYAKP